VVANWVRSVDDAETWVTSRDVTVWWIYWVTIKHAADNPVQATKANWSSCAPCKTNKVNGVWQFALQPHRYGNSHAMWVHTVLPATRQRWRSSLHSQPIEAGTRCDELSTANWIRSVASLSPSVRIHCLLNQLTVDLYFCSERMESQGHRWKSRVRIRISIRVNVKWFSDVDQGQFVFLVLRIKERPFAMKTYNWVMIFHYFRNRPVQCSPLSQITSAVVNIAYGR